MSKDEADQGVKVVDRRRLDDEGEDRAEAAETETTAAKGAASEVQSEAAAADEATSPEPPKAEAEAKQKPAAGSSKLPEIDFSAFIQSLAQQALMHLGVLPHPETGERQRELGLALQTIDILQLLHDKTQGNLTDDEKQLFDAILHDLRLVFVQVQQGGA